MVIGELYREIGLGPLYRSEMSIEMTRRYGSSLEEEETGGVVQHRGTDEGTELLEVLAAGPECCPQPGRKVLRGLPLEGADDLEPFHRP